MVLIGAGAGWAIADSASSPLTVGSPASSSSAPESASAGPSAPGTSGKSGSGKSGKAHTALRGTITAENGPSWTVRAKAGETVTVTITASTKFGTAKAPATQASFVVGTAVVVTGPRTGATVTATRVAAPKPAAATPAPTAAPTS